MSDMRDRLEREEERFTLQPGALERFHDLRLRRQRKRRIGSGALALLLAAGGTWVGFRALQGVGPRPRPASASRIATLPVRPSSLAVGAGAVWVTSPGEAVVYRVDALTGDASTIVLPSGLGPPVGVRVADHGVWVQTGFANISPNPVVVRIDPESGDVAGTFTLGHNEHALVAVSEDAFWSANIATGVVSRRALEDGSVEATIQGPAALRGIDLGEGSLWVLEGSGQVQTRDQPARLVRIDPASNEVSGSLVVGNATFAVGAAGVWLAHAREGVVVRIDPVSVTVADVIEVPGRPGAITAGPSGVWVLDPDGGRAFRIDGPEVESVRVGPDPIAIAQDERGVWVARSDGAILRVG